MSAGRAAPRGRYARWGKAGELRITPVVPGIPEHAGRAARGASPGYRGSQIFLKKGGVDRLPFLALKSVQIALALTRRGPRHPRCGLGPEQRGDAARVSVFQFVFQLYLPGSTPTGA